MHTQTGETRSIALLFREHLTLCWAFKQSLSYVPFYVIKKTSRTPPPPRPTSGNELHISVSY